MVLLLFRPDSAAATGTLGASSADSGLRASSGREIAEPFAFCADNPTSRSFCHECVAEPGTALGEALRLAQLPMAVSWRCLDGAVLACALGASGRACRLPDDGPAQMAAIADYCRTAVEGAVPNAVNYSTVQWLCVAGVPVRDQRYPALALDPAGYIAESWVPLRPPPVVPSSTGAENPVYEDVGSCPFECCAYRSWKVTRDVVLRERRDERSPVVESVPAGATVDALNGTVITLRAASIVAEKGVECRGVADIRAGDSLEVLGYKGEGTWLVRKGRKTAECQLRVTTPPQTAWWIRVRAPSGRVGWTNSPERFDGESKDACS